ncbi:MAG: flavodoxin family protein [Muribaculaceae bacterium]|nr:flavodoxin family protein [Muribaculaceae bacterium]
MATNRRDFIKKIVMAMAAIPVLSSPLGLFADESKNQRNMKKIMIIDGGPRKNMNTAAMIEAFANGAKSVSEEIEVKTIRVYDMNCKGCVSCLACKLKNSKYFDVCARKDDFTEPLRETAYADGIVFASPMYFFQITAQLRAFIERLFFPWLSYNDYSSNPPKGRIPTAFIYTMNAPAEMVHVQENNMNENEMIIGNALEKPERILAVNTLQVKNYDRYDMGGFNLAAKQKWHEEHWQEELQNAFDAGKRMAEKIMA